MGKQSDLLKLAAGQAKRTAIRPFNNIIYQFKKLTNVQTFFSKIFKNLSTTLKELLSARPKSYSDYFRVGGLLIFKKLLIIIAVLICIAPIIYFELINKPKTVPVSEEVALAAEFVYKDPAVSEYSGPAKILTDDKKLVYEGDIDKGVCTGTGKLYDLKGQLVYEGGFKDNAYSGEGVLYQPDRSVLYSGAFADNMKHGQGQLFSSDGSGSLLYEGAFAFDKYDGQGILYNPLTSRAAYKGEFKNGLMNGYGTLYSENGSTLFEGSYLQGCIDFAVFLGSSPDELHKHTSSDAMLYSTGAEACLFYKDLTATFGLETALDKPDAQPVIDSVTVFDGKLPYDLQGLESPKDLATVLGEPLYSGLTFPTLKDMTALHTLTGRGIISKADEMHAFIPSDLNLFISDSDSYSPEIYMVSYDYNGTIINIFFKNNEGGLLFYELVKE